MLNAVNKEMPSTNKHLIISNSLITGARIKHDKKMMPSLIVSRKT